MVADRGLGPANRRGKVAGASLSGRSDDVHKLEADRIRESFDDLGQFDSVIIAERRRQQLFTVESTHATTVAIILTSVDSKSIVSSSVEVAVAMDADGDNHHRRRSDDDDRYTHRELSSNMCPGLPVDPRRFVHNGPRGSDGLLRVTAADVSVDTGQSTQQTRARWPLNAQQLTAEFVGTAFLLAGVVGSGIMAESLTDDVGLQLLQNAFATAGILVALILALGPASGAHFNPAVTLADRAFGGIDTPTAVSYVAVQVSGAIVGVIAANLMFDLSAVNWSTKERTAGHLVFAESIATLGLLLVIFGVVRSGRASVAAISVGAYIAAAYYFTSSTSFANPAVTIARMFSDTFAGIDPIAVPAFIGAQLVATAIAIVLIRVIYPDIAEVADRVVVPHDSK